MVIPLLFRSAGLCIVLVSTGVVLVPVGGAMLVGQAGCGKGAYQPKKRRLILALTVLCSVLLSVMLMIGVRPTAYQAAGLTT